MEIDKIRNISQSNAFTNSRHDLARLEKNALYLIIEKIRHEPIRENLFEENLVVEFYPKDFSDVADQDHTSKAKEALRNLRRKEIDITDADGHWLNVGLVNYVEYKPKFKTFEVEVSKKIIPYFVELSKNFTTLNIVVALSLKSKYTQRFYELGCQYINQVKPFFIDIEDLRKMFRLGKGYKLKSDIQKRVIDVAITELKKAYQENICDFYLECWDEGKGDKTRFFFKIHTRQQQTSLPDIQSLEKQLVTIDRLMLSIFKNDKKFRERIHNALLEEPDKIPQVLEKAIEKVEFCAKKKEHPGGLMRHVLQTDFNIQ